MKSIKFNTIIMIFVIAFLMTNLFGITAAYGTTTDNNSNIKIKSKAAAVLDATNNNVMYSKYGNRKMYPASCTKILTTIIAIENCDLDEEITVSKNAVYGIDADSSHIALEVGEKMTVKDALYAMLLSSANDASVAVAEHISGSVDAFAQKMNSKAKEIGCTNSNFMNPHGLHEKNHYTTAIDLAKIMSYCSKNKTFMSVDSAIKYKMPKTNKNRSRELWNTHRMISTQDCPYSPVIGGKNGYVTASKFNLVTYAEKDNMNLVAVTLGNNDSTSVCNDTEKILKNYFNNYESTDLPKQKLSFNLYNKKNIQVETKNKIHVLLPKDKDVSDVVFKITEKKNLSYPIPKGTAISNIKVLCDNKIIGISTGYNISKINNFHSTISSIFKTVLYVILIVFIILAVVFLLFKYKNKKKIKKRNHRIK